MSTPWTAALWALAALACAALALGLLRLAARLAPLAFTPTHRALLPATAALAAAALVVPAAVGAPLLSLPPLARLGLTTGPGAALSLFALGLALTLGLLPLTRLAFAALRPRDPERSPVPAGFALLGVAPDGQALEHLRRPLRHATLLVLALTAAAIGLAEPTAAPTAPAAAAVLLVGLAAALAPSPASTRSAPAEAAPDVPGADPVPAFHAALGHPPRLATRPEVPVTPASWPGPALLAAAPGPYLALAGPPGSGRRSAALALAAAHPERPTLWLGPTPLSELHTRLERMRLAPELVELTAHPDLEAALASTRRAFGLIVVEAALARSGEAIAALRYGLHRLAANAHEAPTRALVLGDSADLLPLARALLAAEPTLIDLTRLSPQRAALPTRATERYLLPGPPHEPPATPPATALGPASLGPPALHPPVPGEPPVFREYLYLPGGPRGRRLRELLAEPRPVPAPRHLLALPGDREVPEARERLARRHLRAALGEGPQRLARLEEVFSPRLVRAELAALRGSGRLVERPLYLDPLAPLASGAGTARAPGPATLVSAHLPDEPPTASAPLLLREPRSGRALTVARETAALEAYEGARVTLDGRALEVALGVDGERLLVPTQAVHATPIRRLRLAPLPAAEPALSRHRFRGERELEVRTGRLALGAIHHGVRRFADAEGRSHTTLAAEPRLVPPTPVEACALALPEATEAGLHALVHAVREALPLLFVNHADLGVTSARSDELGAPALVLWDRHAEGLGAAHDLAGPDLERLLAEAHALLDCTCPRHCARCCESIDCTQPDLPLDRHEARRLLEPLLTPRALAPRMRSTA